MKTVWCVFVFFRCYSFFFSLCEYYVFIVYQILVHKVVCRLESGGIRVHSLLTERVPRRVSYKFIS